MSDKEMEYLSVYNVLQIMAPSQQKKAVMYDPIQKKLTYHEVEVVGLVDLSIDEENALLTPCFMCSNILGSFWVPELEPTFIQYVKPNEEVDIRTVSDKIKEIGEWWKSAQIDLEPIEVERKGKVSYIKRKGDDNDRGRTKKDP